MNLRIQAVTLFSRAKSENWFVGTTGSANVVEVTVARLQISLSSAGTVSQSLVGCSGHWSGSASNHWGPFHQRWWSFSCIGSNPLEAQSAGFCTPGTCLQQSGGIWSTMNEIWFPMYVLNLQGLPTSQLRTIELSVHANTEVTGTFSTFFTWQSNLVSSRAPHNSSWGMERCLIGATFVLDMTRAVCILPAESRRWK